jgi:hypothetical protein
MQGLVERILFAGCLSKIKIVSNKQLIASFWVMLSIAIICPAKEWRGIVPLKSTRADVERLLGAATNDDLKRR